MIEKTPTGIERYGFARMPFEGIERRTEFAEKDVPVVIPSSAEQLLEEIKKIARGDKRTILLSGPPGAGKTTILQNLTKVFRHPEIKDKKGIFVVAPIRKLSLEDLYESIKGSIYQALNEDKDFNREVTKKEKEYGFYSPVDRSTNMIYFMLGLLGTDYGYDYVVLAIDEFDRLVPSEQQLKIEKVQAPEFEERVIDFLQELRGLLERLSKIRSGETPIPPILLVMSHTSYTAQPFYDYITHEHPAIQSNISNTIDLWYTKDEIMKLTCRRLTWARKKTFRVPKSNRYYPFEEEALIKLFEQSATDKKIYLVRSFLQTLGEAVHLGIEKGAVTIGEDLLLRAKEMVDKVAPPSVVVPIEVYSEHSRVLSASPAEQVKQVYFAIHSRLLDANVVAKSPIIEETRIISDTESVGGITSVHEMLGLANVKLRIRLIIIKSLTSIDWKNLNALLKKAKTPELITRRQGSGLLRKPLGVVEQGIIVVYDCPEEIVIPPQRERIFLLRLTESDFRQILMYGILKLKKYDPEEIAETVRVMREVIKDKIEDFLSTIREITSQPKTDARQIQSWKAISLNFVEGGFQPITLESATNETSVVSSTLKWMKGTSKSVRQDDLKKLESSGLISLLFGGLVPTFPSSLVRTCEEFVKTRTIEVMNHKEVFGDTWGPIRSFMYRVGMNESRKGIKVRTWNSAYKEFQETLSKLSSEDPLYERLVNIEKICKKPKESIPTTNIPIECLRLIVISSAREIAENYLASKPEQKDLAHKLKIVGESIKILEKKTKSKGPVPKKRLQTIEKRFKDVKGAPTDETVEVLISDVRGLGDFVGKIMKKPLELPISQLEVKKELDLLSLIDQDTAYKSLAEKLKEQGIESLDEYKDTIWEYFKTGKIIISPKRRRRKK